jgi:hypothetical protein
MTTNKKSQIEMSGQTFKECWNIDGLEIQDKDNVIVNFINDIIVNIFINGVKKWSVINSIK